MAVRKFTEDEIAKLVRIFGSQEAYERSLPARHWIDTGGGYWSHERIHCVIGGCPEESPETANGH